MTEPTTADETRPTQPVTAAASPPAAGPADAVAVAMDEVPQQAPEPAGRRPIHAPPSPESDRHVAHVMLRAGNVLPSRVLLETLAGRRQLDVSGLLDLAESRWRTGDLGGAGEAVAAYLEAGGEAPLGFLIAAEATSALGRQGEARKLARRAAEDLAEPLDAVFAGQARSGIWPLDPSVPAQPAGTLFAGPGAEAARGGRIGLTVDPRAPSPAALVAAGAETGPERPAPAGPAGHATDPAGPWEPVSPPVESRPDRSIWDADAPAAPDAGAELDAARAALDAGDPRAAAVRLAIVLRISPALAPVVLDVAGQLPGPDFDLLRGDALRLVGHEAAAARAFAAAADALREQQRPPRSTE